MLTKKDYLEAFEQQEKRWLKSSVKDKRKKIKEYLELLLKEDKTKEEIKEIQNQLMFIEEFEGEELEEVLNNINDIAMKSSKTVIENIKF